MTNRERLDHAQAAEAAWRQANITPGVAMSATKKAEYEPLWQEREAALQALAQEQYDATTVTAQVLGTANDGALICLLPRDVLTQLLLCHEAGCSDQEHMGFALDQPEMMRTLKAAQQLSAWLENNQP